MFKVGVSIDAGNSLSVSPHSGSLTCMCVSSRCMQAADVPLALSRSREISAGRVQDHTQTRSSPAASWGRVWCHERDNVHPLLTTMSNRLIPAVMNRLKRTFKGLAGRFTQSRCVIWPNLWFYFYILPLPGNVISTVTGCEGGPVLGRPQSMARKWKIQRQSKHD